MSKRRKNFDVNEPLRHADHPRPRTRREFIRQGFMTGSAYVLGTGGAFSLFANPRQARAAIAPDLINLANSMPNDLCRLGGSAGMMPFICFDLAGGANLAGSNVLVGQRDGQEHLLSTSGYNKLGLPGDVIPGTNSTNVTTGMAGAALNQPRLAADYINDSLGLLFHQDSPLLFGLLQKFTSFVANTVSGSVIPARSDNDTGNNPHNPMYAIAKAAGWLAGGFSGYTGEAVTLIGSRNSESGGNSMSPSYFLDPEIRPTKVDRASDVTGMVDVSDLTSIFSATDVSAVMESIARVSHKKNPT